MKEHTERIVDVSPYLSISAAQGLEIPYVGYIELPIAHFLRYMIDDHHSHSKKLFPDTNLMPKHHFMVHYPDIIIQVGPIVNGTWCMRCEAKHAIGKTLASVVCNFKDICYTIAERHQIRQCHQWFTKGDTVDDAIGPVSAPLVSDTEGRELLLNRVNGLMETDEVFTAKRVAVKGTEYRTGMMVAAGFSNELPAFGNIKAIFIVGEFVFLFRDIWATDHFDDHFHAFAVDKTQDVQHFLLETTEILCGWRTCIK